jgi:hypothetical protein
MPRRTRTQLLDHDEDLARCDREEAYRRLEIELHRAWREACFACTSLEVEPFRSVL